MPTRVLQLVAWRSDSRAVTAAATGGATRTPSGIRCGSARQAPDRNRAGCGPDRGDRRDRWLEHRAAGPYL